MMKKDLKIVFFGTPEFAVESLRRIKENGYDIAGVVTMPDKPAGRGHKMLHSPVKQYAEANGLHLMQPTNLKDPDFIDHLRSLQADLFVVIAFRMLPEAVWQMPPEGTFNLHASLLPRYRGAAPINWAVINGDKETGVTTFFLKHEIDTGDIIAMEKVAINDDDNAGTLHDKLMELGAKLTLDTIKSIADGTLSTTPQDKLSENGQPTPAPKIFKDTCRIDWNMDNRKVHNLVRGLSPYPGAWSELSDEGKSLGAVKILKTRPSPEEDLAPGAISLANGNLKVGCGSGSIEILELQAPGKKKMTIGEYLRGAHLHTPTFSC